MDTQKRAEKVIEICTHTPPFWLSACEDCLKRAFDDLLREGLGECPLEDSEAELEETRKEVEYWKKTKTTPWWANHSDVAMRVVDSLVTIVDHYRALVLALSNDSEALRLGLERGRTEERARVLAILKEEGDKAWRATTYSTDDFVEKLARRIEDRIKGTPHA